jgi:hypothetical protein
MTISGSLNLSYQDARCTSFSEKLKSGLIKQDLKVQGQNEQIADEVVKRIQPLLKGSPQDLPPHGSVAQMADQIVDRLIPMVSNMISKAIEGVMIDSKKANPMATPL